MKMAGMHYESEHTYFAHAFNLKTPFCEVNMMDDLMTVRTTSHVPISEVSGMITESSLREAIELGEITGESLGHKPRIAVAALNPHCGEFGLCGREEVDVIQPTIEKVVKETGWNVTGPYSADTLFISALKGDFDVVVTMYHDQGQIALKLVGFQQLHHRGWRPALSHRHLRPRHCLRQGRQGQRYHRLLRAGRPHHRSDGSC